MKTYYIATASVWRNHDHAIPAENFDATTQEGKTLCGRQGQALVVNRGYKDETVVKANTLQFRQENEWKDSYDWNTETVMCFACEKIMMKAGA